MATSCCRRVQKRPLCRQCLEGISSAGSRQRGPLRPQEAPPRRKPGPPRPRPGGSPAHRGPAPRRRFPRQLPPQLLSCPVSLAASPFVSRWPQTAPSQYLRGVVRGIRDSLLAGPLLPTALPVVQDLQLFPGARALPQHLSAARRDGGPAFRVFAAPQPADCRHVRVEGRGRGSGAEPARSAPPPGRRPRGSARAPVLQPRPAPEVPVANRPTGPSGSRRGLRVRGGRARSPGAEPSPCRAAP